MKRCRRGLRLIWQNRQIEVAAMTIDEKIARIKGLLAQALAELDELQSACAGSEAQRVRTCTGCKGDVLCLSCASAALGLKPDTLRRGAAGTQGIPRLSDRPVRFMRTSIEQFKRARVERAIAAKRPPHRISLVRRHPRLKKD
jgi:hypothetical protein